MRPKMRRNLSGTFLTQSIGEGAWRLSRSEAARIDVFLRGTESGAAEALQCPMVRDIGIEWRGDAVVLTMTAAGQSRVIRAQSAIVHEPLSSLYEALPLVAHDAKARRFWRRVFRLIRIPGGRHLLSVLTRRNRQGH